MPDFARSALAVLRNDVGSAIGVNDFDEAERRVKQEWEAVEARPSIEGKDAVIAAVAAEGARVIRARRRFERAKRQVGGALIAMPSPSHARRVGTI